MKSQRRFEEMFFYLWAALMVLWTPFRGIFRAIYSIFACKQKRSMENEIVLVTGSGRGFGRGISVEMARLGATVVCWDVNESGNLETVKIASKASPREKSVHGYRCDVSNREEVLSVAARVVKEVGNVTMLINNAGIVTAGRLETYKPEDIVRVVNVNFLSHFWMIEAFLPHMKSINSGQIVCISSMSALTPTEYMVPYSATKCAITGLMDALCEELISSNYENIHVTNVYPFFANSNSTMDGLDRTGGMEMMAAQGVVREIVNGVLEKKRDFSIPGSLMGLTNFLKLYPRDVLRIGKKATMGKWTDIFEESTTPVITK